MAVSNRLAAGLLRLLPCLFADEYLRQPNTLESGLCLISLMLLSY
jgi:hypothetical protein